MHYSNIKSYLKIDAEKKINFRLDNRKPMAERVYN